MNDHLRPAVHFSPPQGFMNDPCGLVFDGWRYHMYYQHNPSAPTPGHVHWGHGTSCDLLEWQDEPIAIGIGPKGGQAYTGSAVYTPGVGISAIFTRAYPDLQVQAVATSRDGLSFGNEVEVLNLNMSQFRDPDVKRHANGSWVMSVAKSRLHRVAFYESQDLYSWKHLSDFGPAGLVGVDYECPDLIEIPVEGCAETKWVLFISINPGSPQGGSSTQYWVGDWDGTQFLPETQIVQPLDFCKDNYAMKNWNDMPKGELPTYMAWMGNWQYCKEAPTGDWRGSMSLPRTLELRRDVYDEWKLVQRPRNLGSLRLDPIFVEGSSLEIKGPIEVSASIRLGSGRAALQFVNDNEMLEVGFDADISQIWIDRGNLRGFKQPFFTDKSSAAIVTGATSVSLQIILDGSTLEVYADDGFLVGTVVVYPAEPLKTFVKKGNWSASIYPLKPVMDRSRA